MRRVLFTCLIVPLAILSGCSSNTVKTTQVVPVMQEQAAIPEAELLDVGIHLFDPGLEDANDDDQVVFPEIRKAESRFIPYHLMQTLQSSAAWGAVRVIPNSQNNVDVTVKGQILQSDGEQLRIVVHVMDATGNEWYEKEYEGLASKYAYTKRRNSAVPNEPFQSLYNQIANDMLRYRRENFASADLQKIRTIAELRFAQSFSPAAFGGHLKETSKGEYEITRLPAEGDPMLDRIRQIRERDYLFVDTLQDYYGGFVKDMDQPYQEWRGQSYNEVIALRELKRDARNRTIMGIAALIGGIAAAGGDHGSTRAAGTVAVAGGAYMIKSGFDKRAESEMHVEALQELGDSLEAAIEPQVIELEDRTITLSGTVENQYEQWRELLREIYQVDTGMQ
ncbi:hypothetical protein G8770_00565 [Aestuariicella hydrocarbonica]|uniref:Lipoprotein n=1 Tax=Pseudomaricurvus hydrocarbonicus TaxID=1470433 RepID=A0A9E5JXT2_9GAMM|nr:hypothetical protein [Aestuariicella hydrocarbonica]